MGEEVLRSTTWPPDRAWRLPRLPYSHISGLAHRGAAHLANRDFAHGSRLFGVVPESFTRAKWQEPCAISRFARDAAALCAASLKSSMGSLGSHQARSGDRGVGRNTTTSPLLQGHSRFQERCRMKEGRSGVAANFHDTSLCYPT